MVPLLFGTEFSYLTLCKYGFLALGFYFLFSSFIKGLISPLRRVPGPFLARFTRLWELYINHYYDWPTENIELHKKHGPIVRISPNRYSINDAEAVKTILGIKSGLQKGDYYTVSAPPNEPSLFSVQSNTEHAKMRRPIAQLYSTTNLLIYEPFVDTCNSILMKLLAENAREKSTLNLRQLLQYYAFDVIGEITVGSRLGFMEENGDKLGIIEAIHGVASYSATAGYIPEIHRSFVKLMTLIGFKNNLTYVLDFINKQINDRASGRTKSRPDCKDFIDLMLPLEATGKATRSDTFNASANNIVAGSDTTALSLSSILANLFVNPDKLAILRAELNDAKQRGTLSDPATFAEAQKLPYLQAVILEGLRRHAAVAVPLVRKVGAGGLNIAGQYFPEGVEVGVNPWVIHNNDDIFHDSAKFLPERWIEAKGEERLKLDRAFLPFGIGSRTCIGKNISLLEISKVVPQIVTKFDLELVKGESGKLFSWKTRLFAFPDVFCKVREIN